ncbi:MAG: 2-C-methyl-D-erythritol 4-phosphate cytidylyltransferase [Oscillospiraceae bacterium]|nr:2-C-methyl-D-erythritol 4-phosphate cytidylyltransferase [Oscillospiraceae bacterium]
MEGIDKTVVPICGVPLILRTVRAMAASERITQIVIVTREDLIDTVRELCRGEEKLCAVVPGGSSRTESVLRGLQATSCELVAIHDGARPFVTVPIIDEAIEAAQIYGAAAPAVPVKDTIKIAENNRVSSTPDRSVLYAVQTPQVFPKKVIEACLLEAIEKGIPLTDDCSAAEAAGLPVILTTGSHENLKITTPVDLAFAGAIVERREAL